MKDSKIKQVLTLLFITLLLGACSKDDPILVEPEPPLVGLLGDLRVTTADEKATISGRADTESEVTFQYKGDNGQILGQVKPDEEGRFKFTTDQLVDYEQEIFAFATKGEEVSDTIVLDKIPAKAGYSAGWDQAKLHIEGYRWKSDQVISRVIIKQSQPIPPYDMFATVAQKYYDFKAEGLFHFEVTSPLEFTHTAGTWIMDDKGVITINTVIPLGPMQITNAKIQHLDDNRLTLLANIADGLFLLSMTKE